MVQLNIRIVFFFSNFEQVFAPFILHCYPFFDMRGRFKPLHMQVSLHLSVKKVAPGWQTWWDSSLCMPVPMETDDCGTPITFMDLLDAFSMESSIYCVFIIGLTVNIQGLSNASIPAFFKLFSLARTFPPIISMISHCHLLINFLTTVH